MTLNRFVLSGLAIIAIAFPVLEIVSIYQAWQWLGWWTLAWLLAAVGLGVLLVLDAQGGWPLEIGFAVLSGQSPMLALKGIGLRLAAAVLFIFPGLFSDAVASLLLLYSWFMPEPSRQQPSQDGGVIEGEFRRVDEGHGGVMVDHDRK